MKEPGTLYVCGTPIGNLGDMTYRCVQTLKSADIIAAEDTRNTLRLLNHFDIHTRMCAYHDHNKDEKTGQLVGELLAGKDVALVCDAGMPGISDPGEELVKEAIAAGIAVRVVPGPSASVSALVTSGLPTGRFAFEGFLPKKKKTRKEALKRISEESGTIILYEAPHHLKKTLEELSGALGKDRRIALMRELTKLHEEGIRTTIGGALSYYDDHDPRGEYVLVIEGRSFTENAQNDLKTSSNAVDILEKVEYYEKAGMERKEAMRQTARDFNVSRRDVYGIFLDKGRRN